MKRPSAAIIISSAALFFSVTGASFAAHHYLITSTSQIKPSVINSLRGHTGPRGPAGAPGKFSANNLGVVVGPNVTLGLSGSGTDVESSLAQCPAGTTIVSGGYGGLLINGTVPASEPSGNGWYVLANNNSAVVTATIQAVAICGF